MVLANVRFLAAYRYPDRVDTAAVSWLERQVVTSALLGDLESRRGPAAGDVRAAALHLVWRGVFRIDLGMPLSAASMLERAA